MMIISAEICVLLLFVIWGSFKFALWIRYSPVTWKGTEVVLLQLQHLPQLFALCICELASKIIQILLHVDPPSLTYSDKSEKKFIVHTEPRNIHTHKAGREWKFIAFYFV